MRGLFRSIGIVLALALPGTALAQGGYNGYVHGHIGMHEGYGMHHGYGFNQQTGVIHGRVVRTILPAGLVLVQTREGTVRLSASPSQLVGINQGDRIRLPFVNYNGALWLSPDFGQSRFMGNYGQSWQLQGRIQSIDLARGVIFMNGQRLRINPADLQGVRPGDAVLLRVVNVGRAQWVARLHLRR